jgi:hypothetical protein
MTIGWQELAGAATVAFADAWLDRRAIRSRREHANCSHCPVRKVPRPILNLRKHPPR